GAAATDPGGGALLVLTTSGETWRWNGAAWDLGEASAPSQGTSAPTLWSERAPAGCPPARTGAVMVTDEARHQVLLLGGSASPLGQVPLVPGDTWIWDGSTWTQLHPGPAPPARGGAVAAYDPLRSVVVLYGGVGLDDKGGPVAFDATWTWNGSAWKRQAPKTVPPGQRLASMAWDPGGRTVILLTRASPHTAEPRPWHRAEWTRLHPPPTPPRRPPAPRCRRRPRRRPHPRGPDPLRRHRLHPPLGRHLGVHVAENAGARPARRLPGRDGHRPRGAARPGDRGIAGRRAAGVP